MNLKMRNGNVAITIQNNDIGQSSGGIYLPQTSKPGNLRIGNIIEVGPGELIQGQFIKPELKKDDEVVFDASHAEPLLANGETIWICNMVDVIAIIKKQHLSIVSPA